MAFPTASIINLLTFFIPAAAITLPHSISIGTALLFLMSIIVVMPPLAGDVRLQGEARWGWGLVCPPLDPQEKRLLTVFSLFAAFDLFSIIWSRDRLSQFDTPSRFALAVPIYFLLRRFPPSQGAFWMGTAVGAIGGGLVAIAQRFILNIPFDGGSIHHIRFGDISLVLGGIAAAGLPYFSRFQRGGYLVPMVALTFGIIGSMLSGARGGWPAIPILLYCLYRQHFTLYGAVPRSIKIAAPVMGLLVALSFLLIIGSERVTAAIRDVQQYQLGHKATSLGLRFELWKVAEQAFLDHPILGVGRTGFIATTQDMISLKVIDKMAAEHSHAHNDFLDTLAKRGLLGLITLLLIFIVPARLFIRTLKIGNAFQKPFGMAGLILTVCFLIFCLTETMFMLTLPTTLYVFMVVVLYAEIFSRSLGERAG